MGILEKRLFVSLIALFIVLISANGVMAKPKTGETPTVTIQTDKDVIFEGDASTLYWVTTNADSVSIKPDIGIVPLNGSITVSPTTPTVYNITAIGPGGKAKDNIRVNVSMRAPAALPSVSISADPFAVKAGQSSTISWTSDKAVAVSIDNGIGVVPLAGAIAVTPTQTTTYTIFAEGNGMAGTVTSSATITYINTAPIANNQNVVTDEDTSVAITLSASDVDGDPLTYQSISGPVNGIISGTAPNLSFTPNADFNGTDSFTFIANDGELDSAPATVAITITPVNDAPIALVQAKEILEDSQVDIFLSGTDVDGVALTYQIVTWPANGALIGVASNVTYIPDADYNGSDSFTFKINDGIVDSEPVAIGITITPVNDEPIANTGLNQTVYRLDTVSLDGSGSNDTDGDTLIYRWSFVSAPAESTAIFSDPSLISPTFIPDIAGVYEIQLIVNDGTVDSVSAIMTATANARIVSVPELAGFTQVQAEEAITATGLTVGSFTMAYNETILEGQIISQDPTALISMVEFSPVNFVVSLGPLPPPPTVNITATPESIQPGESVTLSWSSTGAETCTIDQNIGSVDFNGSFSVSPAVTTTYTITAVGQGGETTSHVTITINAQVPAVSISAAPEAIMLGDSTALSWKTSWADSVVIDQDVGIVATSGTVSISPAETTTYTIKAKGPGGVSSSYVTIMVIRPTFRGEVISAEDQKYHESWFGTSVGISDNYAVIGAPMTDFAGKEDCGAAYIFRREGDRWIEHVKLTASACLQWAYFGSSVAISGDYVIIGAAGAEIDDQYAAGTAYIFKRAGETWVEQAILTSTNPTGEEYFGNSVSISGNHAIVGVDTMNDNIYNPQVYVFNYDGGSWNAQAQLTPSDPASYWHFGNSVSISGNYAVVGAPWGYQGSVYVYKYNGIVWQEETILTASDAEKKDNFGYSVSIDDDYIIAGAISKNIGEPVLGGEVASVGGEGEAGGGFGLGYYEAGAAYIFKRETTGWVEQAKLQASNAADFLNFGLSVAIKGDYALVGASHNFFNGTNRLHSNYLYKRYGDNWIEQFDFYGGTDQYFEFSPTVALSDTSFVVGEYVSDYVFYAGRAYIWELPKVTASLIADPSIDPNGESVLRWYARHAATCVIEPGIGSVATNGAIPVVVSDTTTYTLTAVGPLGTATENTTVTVGYPPPELTVSAVPETLNPGESTTLNWSTTEYTETVTIDDGVSTISMPVNGSTVVSPASTTEYTVTAAGPGGSATKNVTVAVMPPEVTITALQTTIAEGESTTLTWISTNADRATIDNGIGTVGVNGSRTVSPLTTTKYTITASGPSGTSTSSVIIIVMPPPPSVGFTATPYAIVAGQSTTLEWTTNATTVLLGYGRVEIPMATSGFLTVSPINTITYRIEARGPGGTTIEAITINVLHPLLLGVAITSPTEGETIEVPKTLVKGIVNKTADEVGITVNGIPAQVNGREFFANNVRLTEGANTITVVATQPDGATASDTATVFVDTLLTTNWIELDVNLESGVAPLNATLRVDPHLTFTPTYTPGSYYLSYDGPGNVTITETNPSEFECDFTVPGMYTFTYTVEDMQGIEYTSQPVAVNVLDRAALDALLKARWNGMKIGLASQDVEGALAYFLETSKDKYRGIYTDLLAQLPQVAADMQNIEMIYARDGRAKYRIIRQQMIEGTPVDITYYIYFNRDANGILKIDEY